MNLVSREQILSRADRIEIPICLLFNRLSRYRGSRKFFAAISRLGDGILWYVLMLCLPWLFGQQGLYTALQMAGAGIVSVVIYKILKRTTIRPRPCLRSSGLELGTAPLDFYRFPSGHTLHAVMFTLIAFNAFPVLGWLLIPFTLLIALSRVVLGLHYPSDVLAGSLIGAGLATLTTLI